MQRDLIEWQRSEVGRLEERIAEFEARIAGRSMLNVIRLRLQALLTAERARAARTTGEPQSFFGRGRGVTTRALREARVELTRLRVLDLALR